MLTLARCWSKYPLVLVWFLLVASMMIGALHTPTTSQSPNTKSASITDAVSLSRSSTASHDFSYTVKSASPSTSRSASESSRRSGSKSASQARSMSRTNNSPSPTRSPSGGTPSRSPTPTPSQSRGTLQRSATMHSASVSARDTISKSSSRSFSVSNVTLQLSISDTESMQLSSMTPSATSMGTMSRSYSESSSFQLSVARFSHTPSTTPSASLSWAVSKSEGSFTASRSASPSQSVSRGSGSLSRVTNTLLITTSKSHKTKSQMSTMSRSSTSSESWSLSASVTKDPLSMSRTQTYSLTLSSSSSRSSSWDASTTRSSSLSKQKRGVVASASIVYTSSRSGSPTVTETWSVSATADRKTGSKSVSTTESSSASQAQASMSHSDSSTPSRGTIQHSRTNSVISSPTATLIDSHTRTILRNTRSYSTSGSTTVTQTLSKTSSRDLSSQTPTGSAGPSASVSQLPSETAALPPTRSVTPSLSSVPSASRSASTTASLSGSSLMSVTSSITAEVSDTIRSITISFSYSTSYSSSYNSTATRNTPSNSLTHVTVTRDRRVRLSHSSTASSSISNHWTATTTRSSFPSLSKSVSRTVSEDPSRTSSVTWTRLTNTRVMTRRSLSSNMSLSATPQASVTESGTFSDSEEATQSRTSSSSPSRTQTVTVTETRSPSHTLSGAPSVTDSTTRTATISAVKSFSRSFSLTNRRTASRSTTLGHTASRKRVSKTTVDSATRERRSPSATISSMASPSISQSPTPTVSQTIRTWSHQLSITLSPSWSSFISYSKTITIAHTASPKNTKSQTVSESRTLATVTQQLSSDATATRTHVTASKTKYSRSPSKHTPSGTAEVTVEFSKTISSTFTVSRTLSLTNSKKSLSSDVSVTRSDRSPSSTKSTTPSSSTSSTLSRSLTESSYRTRSNSNSMSYDLSLSKSLNHTRSLFTVSATPSVLISATRRRKSKSVTISPVLTNTNSASPTAFVSGSRSQTVSFSDTMTLSQSTSFSLSDIESATVTIATSVSREPSATHTPFVSNSKFPSSTKTRTEEITESKTPSPSASVSQQRGSRSRTVTVSPSPTETLTLTSTMSLSSSQAISQTKSKTKIRSRSRRRSKSKSVDDTTHTRTLRVTATPSPSLSVTTTTTQTLSVSYEVSKTRTKTRNTTASASSGIASATLTLNDTHTKSLTSWKTRSVLSITPSSTVTIGSITRLLPQTSTDSISQPMSWTETVSVSTSRSPMVSNSESQTPSSSARTLSETHTRIITEQPSSTASLNVSASKQHDTVTDTQSATVTITVTRDSSASRSATPVRSLSRSRSNTATETVTRGNETVTTTITADVSLSAHTKSQQWTNTDTITRSAATRSPNASSSQPITATHPVTAEPTQSVTQSPSTTHQRSESPSVTPTHNSSRTSSITTTFQVTSTQTKTSSITMRLSPTKQTATVTMSQSSGATMTRTLPNSVTSTGTSDLTLTATETFSRTLFSPSGSRSYSSMKTVTRTKSSTVQSFVRSVPTVTSPPVPQVHLPFSIVFANVPATQSASDTAFIVLHNDSMVDSATNNSCAVRVTATASRGASKLTLVERRVQYMMQGGRNTSFLSLITSGYATRIGRYDVCYFSSARGEWTWWDLKLQLGAYFRPREYLFPKGRLQVNSAFFLGIGVYGATLDDHTVLVSRTLRNMSQPAQCPVSNPTQLGKVSGAYWLTAGPKTTNATFSVTGTVLNAGDYVLCYYGFPFNGYRVALPLVRVEGITTSLSSSQLGFDVTAYYTFNMQVNGQGLSVFDQLMLANGTSCDNMRIPASMYSLRVVTKGLAASSPIFASLTSVGYQLQVLYPFDRMSICFKSNFSNYFALLRVVTVSDNFASAARPNSISDGTTSGVLEFAQGATMELQAVTPTVNGTIDYRVDIAFLCYGKVSRCDCLYNSSVPKQMFAMGRNALLAISGLNVSKTASTSKIGASEQWSLCYGTNASRLGFTAPLDTVTINRFPTYPQLLPAVGMGTTASVFIISYNFTLDNTEVSVYSAGQSQPGCVTTTSSLGPEIIAVSLEEQEKDGVPRVLVHVTPWRVQPMELCFYNNATNETLVSSVLKVVATAPTSFSPSRFVVNQSTVVNFSPSDGSTFNFAATSATIVMCPNVSATRNIRIIVDGVVNATSLRLRFSNATEAPISDRALCFFDPNNNTAVPIPLVNTFSVSSQLISSSFSISGNSALVLSTANAPVTTLTTVTLSITGLSLYSGDLVLSTCSGDPSVMFSLMTSSTSTVSQNGIAFDQVTQTWRLTSVNSGNFSICGAYGAVKASSSTVPLLAQNQNSASSAIFVLFDSLMASAQQLPAIPHSVQIDRDNAYWLVSPTSSDSASQFSRVKVVQLLTTLDDVCTNPVSTELVLGTSTSAQQLVWRYANTLTAFVRSNVTLCYRSVSSKWYSFYDLAANKTASNFFMQAAVLPSTLVYQDSESSRVSTGYSTCGITVLFSGLQLDPTRDSFFFYSTPLTSASQVVCPSAGGGSVVAVSSVIRDTTDLNRLVNVTGRIVTPAVGNIALCATLGDSQRASPAVSPTLLGLITVSSPLIITTTGESNASTATTRIATACHPVSVLTAPSSVRYNYSVRFNTSNSGAFTRLDVPLSSPSFTMIHSPIDPFVIRYTALVAASNALLMTVESDVIIPTSLTTRSTEARFAYCSTFNASDNGAVASSSSQFILASDLILMANFVAANCGGFQQDGSLGKDASGIAAASEALSILQLPTVLEYDAGFLYSTISAVYTSSISSTSLGGGGVSAADATGAFTTLFSATDPAVAIALGGNMSTVVDNNLALLSAAATFVSTGNGGVVAGTTLAPLVLRRFQALISIVCSATSNASTEYSVGSVSISTTKPNVKSATAIISVGDQLQISVSRPGSQTTMPNGNCVAVAAMPNLLPSRVPASTSSVQMRRFIVADTTSTTSATLLPFNLTTVALFSDAPVSSAVLTVRNAPYDRVDAFQGYRYYSLNLSNPSFSPAEGGSWRPVDPQWTPYAYTSTTRTLNINMTASELSVNYLIFSGVASPVYPNRLMLVKESATTVVKGSLYWMLLSVITAHIGLIFAALFFDRYSAGRRFTKAKELLFGLPSPIPRWVQLHRYLCIFVPSPVSLTLKEYLAVRSESAPDRGVPGSSLNDDLTLHPLAVLSTVAKVNTAAMYWYCVLLATVFMNRESIALQIPTLWDEFVLLGGCAALLARPFATWTHVALHRQSQDTPSLITSALVIVAIVIAGAAGKLQMSAVMGVLLATGIGSQVLLIMFWHYKGAGPTPAVSNKEIIRSSFQWSLHHLVHVAAPIQAVSALLFFASFILCVTLLFFVPYFSGRNPIFEYHPTESLTTTTSGFPYFGRDQSFSTFTPDTSIIWKSFILALVLDACVVESFCCGVSVLWMRLVAWWRVGRFITPTDGQALMRKGSGKNLQSFRAPTVLRTIESGGGELEEVSRGGLEENSGEFVDVFSGSPIHSAVGDDDWQKSAARKGSYSFGTTPMSDWDTKNSRSKAQTTFRLDKTGGGIIEEVTDYDDSEADGMFLSVKANDDTETEDNGFGTYVDESSVVEAHDPYEDALHQRSAMSVEASRQSGQGRAPLRLPSRRPVGPDAAGSPLDNPIAGQQEPWSWRDGQQRRPVLASLSRGSRNSTRNLRLGGTAHEPNGDEEEFYPASSY